MKNISKNALKILLIILLCYGVYLLQQKEPHSIQKEKVPVSGDSLELYFFDVGEADSTLIRYKDYNILIDAGNTVDGVLLVPYLKEIGIEHFDSLFVTHAHEDHIGGMSRVVYNFPFDHLYMPNHVAEWKSYQNLMKALERKEKSFEVPSIHQVFTYDDLILTVLSITDTPDYNENSIVLKLDYFNTHYLLMGDATDTIERSILEEDLASDVLKVGHHGSKHSSSAPFLEKVHPEYAIISCAEGNEYGHPHKVVLDKLNYLDTTIYRTDIHHTIHLISDGDTISFDFINRSFNGGDLGDS